MIVLETIRATRTPCPDPGPGAFADRYRRMLERTVIGATVPYGYTALTASSAGVLIDTHGPPGTLAAALYLVGAVLGFVVTALGVSGHAPAGVGAAHDSGSARLGLCGGAAAAASFALAAPLAHAVGGSIAFGLVSLTATAAYLSLGALAAALIDRRDMDRSRIQPVTPATNGADVVA